jgi:hypothetical protein
LWSFSLELLLRSCRSSSSVATWQHLSRYGGTQERHGSEARRQRAPVLHGQPSSGALVRARQSAAIDRSNLPATGSQLLT